MEGEVKIVTSLVEKIRPSAPEKRFSSKVAEAKVQAILKDRLTDKKYDSEFISQVSKQIADEIRTQMRDIADVRYKYCVQVVIVGQRGQGFRSMTRCFWDQTTDHHVTVVFKSPDLLCTATVYAVYFP
eukprot:gnl/Dysnectes_brevis/2432_a2894_1926.p1 GENE.gnl/Dysnectes_brevis/2432_a2894_1926~~gnl/Dysnectes_brevis/2432_a2894_1926.p1  ORF type:complete len:128 (+),score=9.53 gnl/Dysnectes_brevis/2432_a2894_1926:1-384(+)